MLLPLLPRIPGQRLFLAPFPATPNEDRPFGRYREGVTGPSLGKASQGSWGWDEKQPCRRASRTSGKAPLPRVSFD